MLVTDGLKFWVFVDVLHSDQPHVYSVICNTDLKGLPAGVGFDYPMEGGAVRCQVFSDRPIHARQYSQQVVSVMTTQEPDKVAKTDIETLRTESTERERSQVFFECFTFADTPAQVQAQGRSLTIVCGAQRWQIDVGQYDPEKQKTPITVLTQGAAAERFEL